MKTWRVPRFLLQFRLTSCDFSHIRNHTAPSLPMFLSIDFTTLSYLLTYSMVQSPSWEANWFAASQEIFLVYGTRSFITAFTNTLHLSLTWASSIQFILPHPTSWRSILILSFQLRLCLPSGGSFPQVYQPKPYIHLSSAPYALHAQPVSFFSILSPEKYWVSIIDY